MPSSPVLQSSSLKQQSANLSNSTWQDSLQNKQSGLLDDYSKRDNLFHQVQLPQGNANAQSVPHTRSQLLPVGVQGFQQGAFNQSFQQSAPLTNSNLKLEQTTGATLDSVQTFNQSAVQTGMAQSGTIALKPICIEQEAVSFRPGPITIEQPPLLVQPEAITIPQPPIVIHPEPIVIPQAPLVFQPNAVSLARQAVTYQPDAITMARPSYTVQPIIQYDMRGCANFGQADFKQHVHIRLTNEQLMKQGGGNWMQSDVNNVNWQQQQQLGSNWQQQQQLGSNVAPGSPNAEHAKFFSRDRNYNYGNPPTTGDKIKDALGVKNTGPQYPELDNAQTLSRDRDYNYGAQPTTTDRTKDALGVRNYGPEQPVAAPAV